MQLNSTADGPYQFNYAGVDDPGADAMGLGIEYGQAQTGMPFSAKDANHGPHGNCAASGM